MAYDRNLAERVRDQLAAEPDVAEKAMFGGLAFLVGGHMAVAASSTGGLMVRVGADAAPDLVAHTEVEPMAMRGRPMAGWLLVDAAHLRHLEQLAPWVARGTSFARTLPPKG